MAKSTLEDMLHVERDKLLAAFPFMAHDNWYTEKSIVLFGTGNVYDFDSSYFYKNGIKVSALCDNNPQKWGTTIDGVPVLSPTDLCNLKDSFVFITIGDPEQLAQVQSQLGDMKIACIAFRPYVILHEHEHVREAYDLLAESQSRALYVAMVAAKLGLAPAPDEYVMSEQYFALPLFKHGSYGEVFIDAGAFCGSVTEDFIKNRLGCFKKVLCFEPAPRSFQALQKRMMRLKNEWAFDEDTIQCFQAGLGAHSGKVLFNELDLAIGNMVLPWREGRKDGDSGIQLHCLDDLFSEERVDFIKADIEGSEMDMLDGAKAVIVRDKPLLAISIYHRAGDFYRIAIFLKKLVPEYKFSIRQHSLNMVETVLYCYL